MTTIYSRDIIMLSSYIEPAYTLDTSSSLVAHFSTLEMQPGLTILGDSYSVNNSVTWPSQITQRPMQNYAYQGASVDKRYSLKKDLTDQEILELADDLLEQVAKLQYLTTEVVMWFGINDLMTVHHWTPRERTAAIKAEHETLFSVVDALLARHVQHILVPLIIDFSQTPGCSMAREANISVSQDVTQDTIQEWNTRIVAEVKRRPQLSTVDFYSISQEWFENYRAYGLKYLINLEDPQEPAYMWHDFLHMTPYVHHHLLAPIFEKELSLSSSS